MAYTADCYTLDHPKFFVSTKEIMMKVSIDNRPIPSRHKFYEVVSPWTYAFWSVMSMFGVLYLIGQVLNEGNWRALPVGLATFLTFVTLNHREKRKSKPSSN